MQSNAGEGLRTREDEMTCLRGRRLTIRAVDTTGEIDDELAVNVDGELGTVMQTNVELAVELSPKSLYIIV